MTQSRTLILLLLIPALLAGQVQAAGSGRLVRLHYLDAAAVEELARVGADVVNHGDGWVEAVLPPEETLASEQALELQAAIGLFASQETLVEEIDTLLEPFKDLEDAGAYHTLDEVRSEMATLAASMPDLCRIETIGKTFEGRDIQALVVGPQGAAAEGLPRFLICGVHHAREWISVEVPMALAHRLVEDGGEGGNLRELVESRVVWIVPVVNPDGFVYSQSEYKMWRKNRRAHDKGSFGVDPNRNYGYEWGGLGASTYPRSDTYRGESGFSEPETAAIRDLAQREKFRADISFHSYGQLVLWPWSYSRDRIARAREDVFRTFGAKLAEINGYTSKKSSDLYPSSGDYDDFLYGGTGALSFTIELARTFVPDESQIPEITAKNVEVCLYLIRNSEDPFPKLVHEAAPSENGLKVTAQANMEIHDNLELVSLSAVSTTTDGAVHRTALTTVSRAPDESDGDDEERAVPEYEAVLTGDLESYHFEAVDLAQGAFRWPPFRELQPATEAANRRGIR